MNPVLKILKENLSYQEGEKVALILQESTGEKEEKFAASKRVVEALYQTFRAEEIPVSLHSYVPTQARNGVDAPKEFYDIEADIILMPTPFSLTHTSFSRHHQAKGRRLASMPGFTIEMFQESGPLDVNQQEMNEFTQKVGEKLKECKSVHILGRGTDIVIELDKTTVDVSTGVVEKGEVGNIPGAEAYAVPTSNSKGYFTVPDGWGGEFPLDFPVTFHVEKGRIVNIEGQTQEAQAYVDAHVKPFFEGTNFNVLAELGIGTNPNAASFVKKYGWSTLLAEKIAGSAHFANGNSKSLGGTNDVPVHQDWVVPNVKIEFQ
tara:strand:+ start:272 stop:1228 length:957 start_codon:yes stop_codon:yes gene_type:complete